MEKLYYQFLVMQDLIDAKTKYTYNLLKTLKNMIMSLPRLGKLSNR